jgi:hypothetical protein
MSNRFGVLLASVSAVVLMLAASEAVAKFGGGARGGAVAGRPFVAHRHQFRNFGTFWPGFSDFGYGSSAGYGEPVQGIPPQPTSTDIHYTQTYDVPWDWAHRFPPNVTPSDHPYVSSCPVETVTFHGRDGTDKSVNVMRCY